MLLKFLFILFNIKIEKKLHKFFFKLNKIMIKFILLVTNILEDLPFNYYYYYFVRV